VKELTRKGEATPFSRWDCAMDENASKTPAAGREKVWFLLTLLSEKKRDI